MEFLWLFAYNLKFPISIGAGVGLALCTIMFLQGLAANNRSPMKSGDPRVAWSVVSGIMLAALWAAIYAVPAPDYDVRYVEKQVKVPVVRTVVKHAGVKVVEPTWDQRFKYCWEEVKQDMHTCATFANLHKQPRIIERKSTFAQAFQYCYDKTEGGLKTCREYAREVVRMEKPRIQVRNLIRQVPVYKGERVVIKKDTYWTLFEKCNDLRDINSANAQGAIIRNQRMIICKEFALAGSR